MTQAAVRPRGGGHDVIGPRRGAAELRPAAVPGVTRGPSLVAPASLRGVEGLVNTHRDGAHGWVHDLDGAGEVVHVIVAPHPGGRVVRRRRHTGAGGPPLVRGRAPLLVGALVVAVLMRRAGGLNGPRFAQDGNPGVGRRHAPQAMNVVDAVAHREVGIVPRAADRLALQPRELIVVEVTADVVAAAVAHAARAAPPPAATRV